MHIPNPTDNIDKITEKFIITSLSTSSRNSPEYMSKTIFDNVHIEVKSLIKDLRETSSNNTNDMIIKNQIKKVICF